MGANKKSQWTIGIFVEGKKKKKTMFLWLEVLELYLSSPLRITHKNTANNLLKREK